MELVYAVIGLGLIEFWAFALLVGMQRVKQDVQAPATTGNEQFERYHRVHYNTMEQLVLFVPSILMFAHYISSAWAAGIGVVYLVGRIVYLKGYVAAPEKRSIGFMLSWVPTTILMLGGFGAVVWALF